MLPRIVYKNSGWKSMGDWLCTGFVAHSQRKYRNFRDARNFVRRLGLSNEEEWLNYCRGKMRQTKRFKPDDISASPHRTYKQRGWKGLGDWLGTGTTAPRLRKYRSFSSARTFVRALKLRSEQEWRDYCAEKLVSTKGLKPDNIPAAAHSVYAKSGWSGMGDWLGTGTIAPRLKKYRSFSRARAFARKLKLKKKSEWVAYSKGGLKGLPPLPRDIPASPERTYGGKGWRGYGDWLGTGVVATHLRTYRTFKQARSYAHSLRLATREDWNAFCSNSPKQETRLPSDIPKAPALKYAKRGWVSWPDWLGTHRKSKAKRRH